MDTITKYLLEYRNSIVLISNAIYLIQSNPQYTLETKMKLIKQIQEALLDLKKATIFVHNVYTDERKNYGPKI